MRTLFAKYNYERLRKYQTVTKIVQDEFGNKQAIKSPLTNEAGKHIDNIFNHYQLLKNNYDINLVKPEKRDESIFFDMSKGISLEKKLLDAIDAQEHEQVTFFIKKYVDYVDGFVSERNVSFEPCEEFQAVFGVWDVTTPQDLINVANIDLIFSNIFLHEASFSLIDYEWVFDFEIPKSFIIWRAISQFCAAHNVDVSFYSLEQYFLFDKNYSVNEDNFSAYVHGKDKQFFLNKKILKQVANINDIELQKNYFFIQLFIDTGNGFTEEQSIKSIINKEDKVQEFLFELGDYNQLNNLRLDPCNNSCMVTIKDISVYDKNQKINLLNSITSNACVSQEQQLLFSTEDPQIFFNGLDNESLNREMHFHIKLEYQELGLKALHHCFSTLETMLINKDEQLIVKDNVIKEHQEKINFKDYILQKAHQQIELNEDEIQKMDQQAAELSRELSEAIQHCELQERELRKKEELLELKEDEMQEKNRQIKYWSELAEYMRLKNRIKRIFRISKKDEK